MRIDEINRRLAEIRAMMDAPGYDDTQSAALLEEARKLNQEKAEIEARASHTAELRRMVDPEAIGQINRQQRGAQPAVGPDSEEYRRAWLKNMAVRNGVPLLGEMSKEERAAFMATTANTPAVVPTTTMNRIIELVESSIFGGYTSADGVSNSAGVANLLTGDVYAKTGDNDAHGGMSGYINGDNNSGYLFDDGFGVKDTQVSRDLLNVGGKMVKKFVRLSFSGGYTFATYGCPGGAGFGEDGKDSGKPSISSSSGAVRTGNGGNGGNSTLKPPRWIDYLPTAYGYGGRGGYGGGAGGDAGWSHASWSPGVTSGTPGKGGAGGPGGDGSPGCIIIYY